MTFIENPHVQTSKQSATHSQHLLLRIDAKLLAAIQVRGELPVVQPPQTIQSICLFCVSRTLSVLLLLCPSCVLDLLAPLCFSVSATDIHGYRIRIRQPSFLAISYKARQKALFQLPPRLLT